MIVTDTDGDYVTFPEMTEAQCFAAVNEHNALLAHIDALTAAVEGLLDANPDWNDGDLRARLLAILRGQVVSGICRGCRRRVRWNGRYWCEGTGWATRHRCNRG